MAGSSPDERGSRSASGRDRPSDHEIPRFTRDLFGSGERISRIGGGALGGKAEGLIFIEKAIASRFAPDEIRGVEIGIPRMTVIGTDLFDAFMRDNDLWHVALSGAQDRRIAHAFQRADLPVWLAGDLRGLVEKAHAPLAVRSSSLLEDALEHPFAGVYATKMTPNNQHDADTRFRRLAEAVKFVYASTFFKNAGEYIRAVGKSPRDEKMAVIVQEVVGSRHADRFYPDISGVGRSFNFYPSGRARPDEGVVNLALGLGKTIVDGGVSWSFCPAYPKVPPPYNSPNDFLRNTQVDFWAVNMGRPPGYDPTAETEYLVQPGIADAEGDGTLRWLASTYDASSDRLVLGTGPAGPRVLTFAPLLMLEEWPFSRLASRLLAVSREAIGEDVEIEFAMTLPVKRDEPARFGFLQVRSMAVSAQAVEIAAGEMEGPSVLVASERVMGNGEDRSIRDVVYLEPESFDPAATRDAAAEIEALNHTLAQEGRPYLLIGFGRWGSQDPWLGIPVAWSQISGARAIIEATLPRMAPDPSQGSHFFHNITSFHVSYFSIPHEGPGTIDWEWLRNRPACGEGRFVRHVRLDEALLIKVDGRRGAGVIRKSAGEAAP